MKRSYALMIPAVLLLSAAYAAAQSSLTIIFKDHHQQTVSSSEVLRIDLRDDALVLDRKGREEKIPLSQIANIEVKKPVAANENFGRGHFVGRWKVGLDANSPASFVITLDLDGKARKSIDSRRGKWTFIDGTARIVWDDGWTDVIAKAGDSYEKRAYAPGKSLSESPTNVSYAKRANEQSI